MFGRKKDGAKISGKTPVFHVRYIGCTETYVATGKGCSYAPVQRLWDNSPAEKNMRKVAINITPMGLSLRDVNEKSATTTTPPKHPQQNSIFQQQQQQHQQQQQQPFSQNFDIENISFCNVDRAVNERIFSWIYRNDRMRRLDCHAVLCSTSQKAQTMAIVLSRAFQIAYKDWRTHHRNYEPPVTRSATPSTSSVHSLPNAKSPPQGSNGSVASPSPSSAAAAASQPTSHLTSSTTSSLDKKDDADPSVSTSENKLSVLRHSAPASSEEKVTHFFDDVTPVVTGDVDAVSTDVTASSVSVQQSAASSYFVSNCIWDPDMEELVGGVDSLNADLDLEERGSY